MKKQPVNDYWKIDPVEHMADLDESTSDGIVRGFHFRYKEKSLVLNIPSLGGKLINDLTGNYMERMYVTNVVEDEDEDEFGFVDLHEVENKTKFVGFRIVRNK